MTHYFDADFSQPWLLEPQTEKSSMECRSGAGSDDRGMEPLGDEKTVPSS
jgi:hypothetical protein